jgi:cytochrome P450
LLVGGLQTTRDLISASLLCFAREEGTVARLRADPSLVPAAIEEVLRFMPPLLFVLRRTTRPVEINGHEIPADQLLLAWIASGNRDGEHFADPERFVVDRQPNRHLSFGHGIHYCFGAPLARLEAAVALPMILEQLDDLRPAPGAPIDIFSGLVFVIKTLRMTFRGR